MLERAVRVLKREGKYTGRIVADDTSEDNRGLICVNEDFTPSSAKVLPVYIANLKKYTEKDCRRICREIALIIKLAHDNGMAHRNLLLTSFLVEQKSVRNHNTT